MFKMSAFGVKTG